MEKSIEEKKKVLEIVSYRRGDIAKTIDVTGKTDRAIDKIDNGININLNHNLYYTRIVVNPNQQ